MRRFRLSSFDMIMMEDEPGRLLDAMDGMRWTECDET